MGMEILSTNPSMQEIMNKINEIIASINGTLVTNSEEMASIKNLISFGSNVLATKLNSKLWYFKTQELMVASGELVEGDSCFVLGTGAEVGTGNFDYWYIYKTDDVKDLVDSYISLNNPELVAIRINNTDSKVYMENLLLTHNSSDTAHNDIRLLLQELVTRLNAIADSDDETMDQFSELIAFIKSNKSLIEQITTNKVNVTDIVDNLVTNASNKPVSAKQAVILKGLIDAIVIPTSLPASDVYPWAKQPTKPNYTAEEVGATTESYVNEEVTKIKSQIIQQTPLFSPTIEWLKENGDKTKVYVLPDNNIYAYRKGEEIEPPDTTVTITQGLKIDSSTGAETSGTTTYSASNYIEIVDGFTYVLTRASDNGLKSCKVCYYDADKNFISTSSDVVSQDQNAEEVSVEIPLISNAKYFRLRIYSTASSVTDTTFTVTTVANSVVVSGWYNTGNLFVTGEDIKEDFVQAVIDGIGLPIFGTVDEDNTIIISGTLSEGTYSLKYENDDGTFTDIGTLVI